MKTFPKLFKKTSTGADQEWAIAVDGNTIISRWGQCGGAIQETRDVIKAGKNLGKKNETTPEQQAELEAKALWEKKLKKGYVQNLGDARKGKVDKIIEGGVSPMLAHRYDEHGHKIVWPAYVQRKYDGHRCTAVLEGGMCTLWSRTRKRITGVPHIERAIEALNQPYRSLVLDGELYNHDYKDRFEELTSFIRQATPKPGHEVVQFHAYDVASSPAPFTGRFDILCQLGLNAKAGPLRLVQTEIAHDEDELMLAFERFVAEGFEGAMVRNAAGAYVNKRSYDLLKVKEFMDAEFPVVGVEEGRGKLAGHAIFVCKTKDGVEFRAKMKGETAALKKYFANPKLAIGRQLTVKYQGITAANGVPRFPVALRFREEV